MAKDPETTKGVMLPMGLTDRGLVGLHVKETGTTVGVFQPLQEGQPVMGDVTILNRVEGKPYYATETLHTGHSGPARVNNEAFRDGWDRIFGKGRTVPGEA